MAEIICAGSGGQGVLTAGHVLINIGLLDGKNVCWSPAYGSEMRGGEAHCNVIITEEELDGPAVAFPDYLLVMTQKALDKFKANVKKDGIIVADTTIIPKDAVYPEGVKVFGVDATQASADLKHPRAANLVMVGALIRASGCFSKELAIQGLNKYFDDKGKNSPKNVECFLYGYEHVTELSDG